MYRYIIKTLFDIIFSILILVLFLPIIVIIIIALVIFNKSNVFFIQERPGKNGKIFKLYKFKTMTDEKDIAGNLLPDEKRITKVGNIIRKLSIDELLQFVNVLKGDMSIIGPRPLLIEYLPLYNDHQKKRHNVKPGITGWAQVNGRNAITWKEKFKLDVWYVENVSFILDIKIFFMTIMKIFKSDGISSSNSATMEKFRGNKD